MILRKDDICWRKFKNELANISLELRFIEFNEFPEFVALVSV